MVVFVHNLSYEFQFLKSIIPVDEVFAMDKRKILYFRSGKLEFRCSYLLTNQSLSRFLKSMKVKDQKLTDFDYSKQRYPWTAMTEEEIHYCVNDVKGLTQAIIKKMKLDHDDLYTIPRTSTGYSRRLSKQRLSKHIKWIRRILPDLEVFRALRDEFRGGDTHAHRFINMHIKTQTPPQSQSCSADVCTPSLMHTHTLRCAWQPQMLRLTGTPQHTPPSTLALTTRQSGPASLRPWPRLP
jgi:hypothetical protein